MSSALSPLEWTRARPPDSTGGAGGSPSSAPRRDVAMSEVRAHRVEGDAWVAVRGKVYDVTSYLPYHPGGVDEMMRAAGRDATALFEEYHRWVNVDAMLRPCLVGTLRARAPDAEPETWPSLDSWTRLDVRSSARVADDCHLLSLAGAAVPHTLEPPPSPSPVWHVALRVQIRGAWVERCYTPIPRWFLADVFSTLAEEPLDLDDVHIVVRRYAKRRPASWALTHAMCPAEADASPSAPPLVALAQPCLPRAAAVALWARGCSSGGGVGFACAGTGLFPALQLMCRSLADPDDARRFWVAWMNRSLGSAPMRESVERLARRFPGRVALTHVLSSREGSSGVASGEDAAAGVETLTRGRFDAELLKDHPRVLPLAECSAVFYCGSFAFERAARTALLKVGFGASDVERF